MRATRDGLSFPFLQFSYEPGRQGSSQKKIVISTRREWLVSKCARLANNWQRILFKWSAAQNLESCPVSKNTHTHTHSSWSIHEKFQYNRQILVGQVIKSTSQFLSHVIQLDAMSKGVSACGKDWNFSNWRIAYRMKEDKRSWGCQRRGGNVWMKVKNAQTRRQITFFIYFNWNLSCASLFVRLSFSLLFLFLGKFYFIRFLFVVSGYFWHITDIHFDIQYSTKGDIQKSKSFWYHLIYLRFLSLPRFRCPFSFLLLDVKLVETPSYMLLVDV